MSLSNAAEQGILALLFNNTTLAAIGDATGLVGSSTAGSLYVSLHVADPGEAGSQTTSEATYTSYARVAVARSGAGWIVSGTAPTQVANAAAINFPICTAGASVVTHFGIGTAASGAGVLLWSGALNVSLAVSAPIQPILNAGACVMSLD